jgi:hypothetical protein|tara:strand:- start:130 stop:684 length:555 start_codon:yes stop_codon:yes gene_type:complete
MIYPTIVVENFFKDTKLIFDFLKKVKWSRAKDDENWPGVRSESFHKINPELHSFIMNKIISVYYEYRLQQVFWESASIQFHKTKPSDFKKWKRKETHIHKDNRVEIAGVIYLNKTICEKSGTTIYNKDLKKQVVVSNNFNSLLLYDANKFHGVTEFTDLETLRLVIFINKVTAKYKFLDRIYDC